MQEKYMLDFKEMLNQMEKGLNEAGFDEAEIMRIKEIFKPPNLKTVDKYKNIGLYLYYHLKIEKSIERLISALAPEINLKDLEIKSFYSKVKILKLLTLNSSKLEIFNLLYELNSIRNEFSHEIKVDSNHFENKSKKLKKIFKTSFSHKLLDKSSEDNRSKNSPIFDILEIIIWTSRYVELLATQEDIGAKKDMKLKLFKIVRGFSHKFIARRFSILMYMFQTGIKSGEAPEEFKMREEFEKDIEQFKTVSFSIKFPIKVKKKV